MGVGVKYDVDLLLKYLIGELKELPLLFGEEVSEGDADYIPPRNPKLLYETPGCGIEPYFGPAYKRRIKVPSMFFHHEYIELDFKLIREIENANEEAHTT